MSNGFKSHVFGSYYGGGDDLDIGLNQAVAKLDEELKAGVNGLNQPLLNKHQVQLLKDKAKKENDELR